MDTTTPSKSAHATNVNRPSDESHPRIERGRSTSAPGRIGFPGNAGPATFGSTALGHEFLDTTPAAEVQAHALLRVGLDSRRLRPTAYAAKRSHSKAV